MPISLAEYWMGRDKTHAHDLTPEIMANASATVSKVNDLLVAAKWSPAYVNSGWRPPSINAGTPGAAVRSKHMLALACDIRDTEGKLGAWCMANLPTLERIGLWLEHPRATRGWCHVQTVKPRSGNRVFQP